jgi:hypothetical protein
VRLRRSGDSDLLGQVIKLGLYPHNNAKMSEQRWLSIALNPKSWQFNIRNFIWG